MNEQRLPVLISIPHGGTVVPEEVQGFFRLGKQEVLRDGDTWTREIFDYKEKVIALVDTEVPRVVIDLNRGKEDLPPENFDGVVKTKSVFLNPVWENPLGLDEEQQQGLMRKYYDPYYQRIFNALDNPGIKLGIDCHSMLPKDPFDERAEKRPLFCISNRGDHKGKGVKKSLSAPPEILWAFKERLEREFGKGSVAMNTPFKGGYITGYFGMKKGVPWIQLEVNRSLYLPPKGYITSTPQGESRKRVQILSERIFNGIKGLKLE